MSWQISKQKEGAGGLHNAMYCYMKHFMFSNLNIYMPLNDPTFFPRIKSPPWIFLNFGFLNIPRFARIHLSFLIEIRYGSFSETDLCLRVKRWSRKGVLWNLHWILFCLILLVGWMQSTQILTSMNITESESFTKFRSDSDFNILYHI